LVRVAVTVFVGIRVELGFGVGWNTLVDVMDGVKVGSGVPVGRMVRLGVTVLVGFRVELGFCVG